MEHTNAKSEKRTCYRAETLRTDKEKKIALKETRLTHRGAVVKKKVVATATIFNKRHLSFRGNFYERGPPEKILMDNDTAFYSRVFQVFLEGWISV